MRSQHILQKTLEIVRLLLYILIPFVVWALIRKTRLDFVGHEAGVWKSDRCERAIHTELWCTPPLFWGSIASERSRLSLFTQSRTPSRWPCRLRTHMRIPHLGSVPDPKMNQRVRSTRTHTCAMQCTILLKKNYRLFLRHADSQVMQIASTISKEFHHCCIKRRKIIKTI